MMKNYYIVANFGKNNTNVLEVQQQSFQAHHLSITDCYYTTACVVINSQKHLHV